MLDTTTFIPSYSDYSDTWSKAGYFNPFAVDWMKYDPTDTLMVAYLDVAINTINEQISFWGADSKSAKSRMYAYVDEFNENLKLLYQQTIAVGGLERTRTVVAVAVKPVYDDDMSGLTSSTTITSKK